MNSNVLVILRKIGLTLLVGAISGQMALAQTPQTPPTSPSQQDATRPPGTQNNQPIPPNARPTTIDPTAPPGTVNAPQTGTPTKPSTVTPLRTPVDTNQQPINPTGDFQEPTLPNVQPHPVPP